MSFPHCPHLHDVLSENMMWTERFENPANATGRGRPHRNKTFWAVTWQANNNINNNNRFLREYPENTAFMNKCTVRNCASVSVPVCLWAVLMKKNLVSQSVIYLTPVIFCFVVNGEQSVVMATVWLRGEFGWLKRSVSQKRVCWLCPLIYIRCVVDISPCHQLWGRWVHKSLHTFENSNMYTSVFQSRFQQWSRLKNNRVNQWTKGCCNFMESCPEWEIKEH